MDEFTFKIIVDTLSEPLTEPVFDDRPLLFTVGVFMIIKVVGKVQLLIPEYGFCPVPPECENFQPEEICDGLRWQISGFLSTWLKCKPCRDDQHN